MIIPKERIPEPQIRETSKQRAIMGAAVAQGSSTFLRIMGALVQYQWLQEMEMRSRIHPNVVYKSGYLKVFPAVMGWTRKSCLLRCFSPSSCTHIHQIIPYPDRKRQIEKKYISNDFEGNYPTGRETIIYKFFFQQPSEIASFLHQDHCSSCH